MSVRALAQDRLKLFELDFTILLLASGVASILAAGYLLYSQSQRLKTSPISLPILNLRDNDFENAKQQYLDDLPNLLRKGYAAYKHGLYQLWGVDGYITLVSTDFLDEMISLPRGTLDFHAATQKRMIGDYTWLTVADDLLAHTISVDLNRQIGAIFPILCEEIENVIQDEFPVSEDWEPLDIHAIAPRLIATVMGRVFVGEGLNRDEKLLNTALQFVDDVFAGGWKLKSYSILLRPIAARFFVKEIRRVRNHLAVARALLFPVIRARKTAASQANYERPNDLIQWLIQNEAKAANSRTMADLAELTLVAYLGSTHTTATTLSNLLYELDAHPECLEDLRSEIRELEVRHGGGRTKQSLDIASTSKLDSCMKESQRLSPAFLMSFSRIVSAPMTLAP